MNQIIKFRKSFYIKINIFIFAILFILNNSLAQNQTNIWIIGNYYGIDFNYNRFSPFERVPFDSVNLLKTSSSICDENTGKLLFYSDGFNVYDKNFQVMPNGREMLAGRGFGQTCLIVPDPANAKRYYLFTTRSYEDTIKYTKEGMKPVASGLYYSIVDMHLNGGLGDVVSQEKNILLLTKSTATLTAVQQDNGLGFWLITHEWQSNRFAIFNVTNNGIDKPFYQAIGHYYKDLDTYQGTIQVSPDRSKLAIIINTNFNVLGMSKKTLPLEVYDFDSKSGTLSNPQVLGNFSNGASTIFSPDNGKLYVSYYGVDEEQYPPLTQFDLTKKNTIEIINSKKSIYWNFKPFKSAPGEILPTPTAMLQLAPDGKLYNGVRGIVRKDPNFVDVVLFRLDHPNKSAHLTEPGFVKLFKKPLTDFINYSVEITFPNFMQHHFHNLESREFIIAEECRLIDLIALPNPTIDKVKLKLERDKEECFFPVTVEVFNVLGQKIQVNHWQTGTVEVDLSSLAPATYIFKIKYANNYQAIKVIKY